MVEENLYAEFSVDCVKNRHGIRIKRGCYSCRHQKFCDSEKTRFCKMDKQEHPRCHLCEHWKMKPSLQKAGNSGGRVKRHEYLDFIAAMRAQEGDEESRDVASIRAEFERLFGSIYVNM